MIAALNLDVAVAGIGWLTLGMLVYVVYRRRQGLDLVSTHKVAIPQPVVDHEAEYDSVLVPSTDGYDEHVMATAAKLAARKRRGIHVVAFVTVPHALADRRADARRGGRRAVGHRAGPASRAGAGSPATSSGSGRARRGGGSSRRRIDMRAAAIVLALPRRVDGASLFGKTLETVLAERPCRVVIESDAARPTSAGRRQLALERAAT